MNHKVRLFVRKELMAPGMSYSSLLYPFWGPPDKQKAMPYVMNALVMHGFDKNYFELVDAIDGADYVLIPHDYWRLKKKRPDLLRAMIQDAQAHQKPLLIDAASDQSGVVNVPNARVMRINQYRFEPRSYEITMPVSCEDLLEVYQKGTLTLREKHEIPTVGFVGWAELSLKQRLRSLLKELPIRFLGLLDHRYRAKEKGVFWRERVVRAFLSSRAVATNFIIRSSYSGHTETASGELAKIRTEYVDNLVANDYALVVRGDANIATRFYEILSVGRIPVFIDTECMLPLSDRIDYRSFCVFIDHTEVARAPEILAAFHEGLDPQEFKQMQQRARDAYERYLRYDAFSPYLAQELLKDGRAA